MSSPLTASLLGRLPGKSRNDRREVRRLLPAALAVCRLILPETGAALTAWIHNISIKGAGLLSDHPCPMGATLPVFLVNAAHSFGMEIGLRIVRCERGVGGDYYVGGEFSRRLTSDELAYFLV